MFIDCIGRIDDETPFVAEWLVKHGIEVWSTQEGKRSFGSHVEKLMNYIRFWQATGESEKTSIRVHNKDAADDPRWVLYGRFREVQIQACGQQVGESERISW